MPEFLGKHVGVWHAAGLMALPEQHRSPWHHTQAKGFTVIALPMKIGGDSGGPLRIFAVLP